MATVVSLVSLDTYPTINGRRILSGGNHGFVRIDGLLVGVDGDSGRNASSSVFRINGRPVLRQGDGGLTGQRWVTSD